MSKSSPPSNAISCRVYRIQIFVVIEKVRGKKVRGKKGERGRRDGDDGRREEGRDGGRQG